MSIRVDSSSLIAGAVVVGDPGLGVLAEMVPSTGEHGPGIASTWLGPAEAGKEARVLITQLPEVGSLFVWEDTSFEYNGPGGTAYAQLYVEGQPIDTPQPVTMVVGAGATYNDSVSEPTTLSDTAAATNTLTALLAETVSLLDQLNTGNVFNEAHAAAVTPADSFASAAIFSATLSEAVAAGDFVATQSDQATLPRTALTARITALSFAARVQATSLSARPQ